MSEPKSVTNSSRNQNKGQIKFEEGEKILCFHGDLIYEAKCSKVDYSRSNEKFYFVHYNGWNKNWDEWVTAKRILKLNEENIKKQQELIAQSRVGVKKNRIIIQNKKDDDSKKECTESLDSRKNKKPIEDSDSAENETETDINENGKRRICVIDISLNHNRFLTNSKIRVSIPLSLQEWLVDDFHAVMQQNKLMKIPSSNTVKSILNDYKSFKTNETRNDKVLKEINETVSGLIRYFNVMLGSQLLYKFERIQYSELLETSKDMSEIYGAIHLLRLIEKLNEILAYAPLQPKPLETLLFYVNDILRYLNKENSNLFHIDDYMIAPPNYIRAAF